MKHALVRFCLESEGEEITRFATCMMGSINEVSVEDGWMDVLDRMICVALDKPSQSNVNAGVPENATIGKQLIESQGNGIYTAK